VSMCVVGVCRVVNKHSWMVDGQWHAQVTHVWNTLSNKDVRTVFNWLFFCLLNTAGRVMYRFRSGLVSLSAGFGPSWYMYKTTPCTHMLSYNFQLYIAWGLCIWRASHLWVSVEHGRKHRHAGTRGSEIGIVHRSQKMQQVCVYSDTA